MGLSERVCDYLNKEYGTQLSLLFQQSAPTWGDGVKVMYLNVVTPTQAMSIANAVLRIAGEPLIGVSYDPTHKAQFVVRRDA